LIHQGRNDLNRAQSVIAICEEEGGDCFEAAGRLIMDLEGGLLVHGCVDGRGPLKGKRFVHGWVEMGDLVFDFSGGKRVVMSREQYYQIGNIRKLSMIGRPH